MIIGIGHKARQGKDLSAEYLRDNYGFKILHFADAIYRECRNLVVNYNSEDHLISWTVDDGANYEELSALKVDSITTELLSIAVDKGLRMAVVGYNDFYKYHGMKDKDTALLQFWGVFRRENFGEDYWIKQVAEIIDSDPDSNYVIPDCRFPGEAEFVKQRGGKIWEVQRYCKDMTHIPAALMESFTAGKLVFVDGDPFIRHIADDRNPDHITETALDGYEFDEVLINIDGDKDKLYKYIDKLMEQK
jgi:hypothetical protein